MSIKVGYKTGIKFFFFVFSLAHSSPVIAITDKNGNGTTYNAPTMVGKRLVGKNMDILNMLFTQYPIGILRIKLANQAMEGALKKKHEKIEKGIIGSLCEKLTDLTLGEARKKEKEMREEKEFVQSQVKEMMAPVENFFESIAEYHHIVKPLVEESLRNHDVAVEHSFLMNFFTSKIDIKAFCEKKITTLQELDSTCHELRSFFADLTTSLSDSVNKAVQELTKTINARKKAGQK